MNSAFEKRLMIVWAILSAITVVQYLGLSAGGRSLDAPNGALTTSVILVSLIKVRLILMEFMEARHASLLLRRMADLWLVVTAFSLLLAYFAAPALLGR